MKGMGKTKPGFPVP